MNYSDVEKAVKIIERIKEIDAAIIRFEKLAMQAANDECEVGLSFSIEDYKEIEPPVDVTHQYEGYEGLLSNMITNFRWRVVEEKSTKTTSEKEIVSNTIAMQIFGLIISDKNIKRQKLINQLKQIGVTI